MKNPVTLWYRGVIFNHMVDGHQTFTSPKWPDNITKNARARWKKAKWVRSHGYVDQDGKLIEDELGYGTGNLPVEPTGQRSRRYSAKMYEEDVIAMFARMEKHENAMEKHENANRSASTSTNR